jgi:hypothetical protein
VVEHPRRDDHPDEELGAHGEADLLLHAAVGEHAAAEVLVGEIHLPVSLGVFDHARRFEHEVRERRGVLRPVFFVARRGDDALEIQPPRRGPVGDAVEVFEHAAQAREVGRTRAFEQQREVDVRVMRRGLWHRPEDHVRDPPRGVGA